MHGQHFVQGAGHTACHVGQGLVVADDIGRHPQPLGQLQSAGAELLEQVVRVGSGDLLRHQLGRLHKHAAHAGGLLAGGALQFLHIVVLLAHAMAAAVAFFRGALAEVFQDVAAQAMAAGGVVDHGLQPPHVLLAHGLLLVGGEFRVGVALLDHPLGGVDVRAVVQQDALRIGAVAASAASLLVVGLHGAGHVVVDHIVHVGLVDAHAKGVGGHHDLHPVVLEVLLGGAALLIGKASVVAPHREALGGELVADLLHGLAGGAVDDAALLLLCAEDGRQRRVFRLGTHHLEIQVGAVEAGGGHGGGAQAKQADDIIPHASCGGGREGAHGRAGGQGVHKISDFQIVRAEVLPPLGHAMRLVHRNEGDGRAAGKLLEGKGLQALGSHVNDAIGTHAGALGGQVDLPRGEGAVQVGGGDAGALQGGYLILHQGDQGGDHQGDAGFHQRGDLVAHGLACACGHDAQAVAALQQGVHQRLLPGTEAIVAEIMLQGLQLIHGAPPSLVIPSIVP